MYNGNAEYNTIKSVKNIVSIPIIANGDINSPQTAKKVLAFTGANAIMIGRAAQGNPWIFNQVNYYLTYNNKLSSPSSEEIENVIQVHLDGLYSHYGKEVGVRVARKHITWYLKNYRDYAIFKDLLLKADCTQQQQNLLKQFFKHQHTNITELAA